YGRDPGFREGTIWVAKPFVASTRDVFRTPRSPWEARLYGMVEGTVNRKIAVIWQRPEGFEKPVKPIVLLCPDGLSGINI
ncbi:MAG TPA: hypothetical protein VEC14_04420, partial [Reyranellaceae bacterium]|nr:hypothetical protein [Reyranellaceae bacterium]